MEMLSNQLTAYLEQTCDPEPELLKRVNRQTYVEQTRAHMLSGHYQGRLLSF